MDSEIQGEAGTLHVTILERERTELTALELKPLHVTFLEGRRSPGDGLN